MPTAMTMSADDYLSIRGVTVEWLEELASDTLKGQDAETDRSEFKDSASVVVSLAAEMIEAGATLPPTTAKLIAAVLRDTMNGVDARKRIGTKARAGNPGDPAIDERHEQISACLALLRLAGIKKTVAVSMVACAAPLADRQIYNLDEINSDVPDLQSVQFLADMAFGESGYGVLRRLLDHPPTEDPKALESWHQFQEFMSVNMIR